MRVATYNIHRAIGADGRQDVTRIARVLREIDADVVALQEVAFPLERSGHLLEHLGRDLRAQVIEGVTMSDERGHYGNAILTRMPVSTVDRLDISVPRREPRGAIEIAMRVADLNVRLVATHLGLRPGERRSQIKSLLPRFEHRGADVKILLGDLNEWFLWGRPVRWLRRVFGETPAPRTFPAKSPWFALDRLWVSPRAAIAQLRTHSSPTARTASDHLPLVADLDLTAVVNRAPDLAHLP